MTNGAPMRERGMIRLERYQRCLNFCKSAELIFLDLDNELRKNLSKSPKMDRKYFICAEAADYYNSGSNVMCYCYKGRRSKENREEYKKWMIQKGPDVCVFGLPFHRGTQRSFIFVLYVACGKASGYSKWFLKTS